MSQLNKSSSGKHAFDLDAEPEPIPEDLGDDDGGYDALDDDNDHGGCSVAATFSCDCCSFLVCLLCRRFVSHKQLTDCGHCVCDNIRSLMRRF